MTEIITLEAQARDRVGKGAARATRRAGQIPAVIYGDGKPPVTISLDPKIITRVFLRGGFQSHLIDLQLDGATHRTLPRDVQLHPVTDAILHVDFVRVGAGTRTHVNVAVVFDNQDKSPGLKRGGVLNIVRHEVELICAADAIPERVHVDVSGYDIGESIHISAVQLPEGTVPAIADRDFTIATIVPPTVRGEEPAAATPAA
ncbi:MAG: 50S ribosomal protein L25/general stress protein Ctc [Aliidongia sp.]